MDDQIGCMVMVGNLVCYGNMALGSRAGMPLELSKPSLQNLLYEIFCYLVFSFAANCPPRKVVASGILYIVMYGNPDKACLASLFEPLLKRLPQAPHSGWEALDCAAMQRVRKPVWYQVRRTGLHDSMPEWKF